jgi:hypothetical protein
MKFNRHVARIDNDVQDRGSDAWKALCRYVDELADSGGDEFAPREALGPELYAGIFTLPESIARLKRVTKVHLYGSKLKRIPPEIGEMAALTHFDVYTSYGLQWFPYELTRCNNLIHSRVSTRAVWELQAPATFSLAEGKSGPLSWRHGQVQRVRVRDWL